MFRHIFWLSGTDVSEEAASCILKVKTTGSSSTRNVGIQGVSRLRGVTAGGDFLGFCDKKSSYKHVSDFGRLRSYGRFFNFRARPRVNRV